MTQKELKTKRTNTLRKLAEEAGVADFADLDRAALLEALSPKKTPKAEEAPEPKAKASLPEEAVEPVPTGVSDEHAPVGSKAQRMKEVLAKQPKVRILIPLGESERIGSTKQVILNGYRLNIQKGVYVEVPEQVATLVEESEKMSRQALEHPRKLNPDNVGPELKG